MIYDTHHCPSCPTLLQSPGSRVLLHYATQKQRPPCTFTWLKITWTLHFRSSGGKKLEKSSDNINHAPIKKKRWPHKKLFLPGFFLFHRFWGLFFFLQILGHSRSESTFMVLIEQFEKFWVRFFRSTPFFEFIQTMNPVWCVCLSNGGGRGNR